MSAALEQLKTRFRARCGGDRGELARLATDGDRDGLRHLAHKLAGAAGTFGFFPLGETALLLEGQLDLGEPIDPALLALMDAQLAAVAEGAPA